MNNPWKATWEAHIRIWTVSCQPGFHESFRDSSQVARDLQNSLSKHLWNVFFTFLYQHYISLHYPWNCKELLIEKTLTIHLKVRDCKPTIIYTIFLSFPLLLPLQLQNLEIIFSNTYLTQFEFWVKFWYMWEALEETIDWRMQFGANCGIRITSEDKAWWSPLVAGTLRVQVHWVD